MAKKSIPRAFALTLEEYLREKLFQPGMPGKLTVNVAGGNTYLTIDRLNVEYKIVVTSGGVCRMAINHALSSFVSDVDYTFSMSNPDIYQVIVNMITVADKYRTNTRLLSEQEVACYTGCYDPALGYSIFYNHVPLCSIAMNSADESMIFVHTKKGSVPVAKIRGSVVSVLQPLKVKATGDGTADKAAKE